jgi:hypothetical protein
MKNFENGDSMKKHVFSEGRLTRGVAAMSRILRAFATLALLSMLAISPGTANAATEPTTLPVYAVVKTGATAAEAAALAKQLGIPSENILSAGGAIEFVDSSQYLSLPTETAPDSKLLKEAIAATRNKDSSREITATILNANAIDSVVVVPAEVALAKAAAALRGAGLTPQFGQASVGHHELSLFSKDK